MAKGTFNLTRLVNKTLEEKEISLAIFAQKMGLSIASAYNVYVLGSNSSYHNQRISTIMALAEALDISEVEIFKACVEDRREYLKQ